MTQDEGRAHELARRLRDVDERVRAACARVGRDPEEVTVVVVTKTRPPHDVRLLAALGVRDVGENRHQEAVEKHAACADLGLRWHFVGQLQTKKARAVAKYADAVHSVDRGRLVAALSHGAVAAARDIDVFLQINLDPDAPPGRGGAQLADLPALADAAEAADGLHLRGVMAVAPREEDPARAFARLASISARLVSTHPAATGVSAGMSGDLEQAIEHGATHLRIGGAILGARDLSG